MSGGALPTAPSTCHMQPCHSQLASCIPGRATSHARTRLCLRSQCENHLALLLSLAAQHQAQLSGGGAIILRWHCGVPTSVEQQGWVARFVWVRGAAQYCLCLVVLSGSLYSPRWSRRAGRRGCSGAGRGAGARCACGASSGSSPCPCTPGRSSAPAAAPRHGSPPAACAATHGSAAELPSL
jgi:hypothetical protein